MKKIISLLGILLLFIAIQCDNSNNVSKNADASSYIQQQTIDNVIKSLINKYSDTNKFRIERGVNQLASLWTEKDGSIEEFKKFCLNNFINSDEELEKVFKRLSTNLEILKGNFNKIILELKRPLHLDIGEILPIDLIFGGYAPSAHFEEDLFQNKIAFIIKLNFPFYSLQEKTELAKSWTRKQWAYARMGDLFTSRIPAGLIQKHSEARTNANAYISEYNIYMGNLIDNKNNKLFPDDLKLISHWGLRDELKSNYNNDNGFEKQKIIYEVMKRIITQEIPESYINNNKYLWNPYQNRLFTNNSEIKFKPEPNTRYQYLLSNFTAIKDIDAYNPKFPTYIKRKFEKEMEITYEQVEKLFIDFISSQQVKRVAELIKERLGRKLEPFDIWYDGFKPRSSISENELNEIVCNKYPTKEAFENDLTDILLKLDFSADKAEYITSKISVDASRGAGHAWGAEMKSDKAHLRTRINENGMDYKGYNIAIHEFGHNVEQTISLQYVDYYLLNGVPNTAFTEALAFIFQKRDLELLGIKHEDPNKKLFMALDNVWSCFEIMGVSLVDMNVWKWLYEHPDATEEELKNAVISISIDLWNKYYAALFGIKDQPILAIYSHMISYPLYLPAYPLGLLIDFQIEKQIEGKNFASEIERIFIYGRITPQQWMKNATGSEISIEPMLDATEDIEKL